MIEKLKSTYRKSGADTISRRKEVEAFADEVCKKGIKNIFFAGSGGSITTLTPFPRLIKRFSNLPAYAEEAAELMVSDYKQLNKDSLVVIMAKTGTMVETVKLSEYCQERGIPTVGFVMIDNTPVANNVTYKILIDEFSSPIRYITMYYFVFRLLYNLGDFPEYEKFADELANVPESICDMLDAYDDTAKKFVELYSKEPFQLWLYSGINFGEALKYSADIAEELFRQKTQVMNTAEFFHGCLEIVDNDVSIVLLMSEDGSRTLDERAKRFLEKYAGEKLFVIDTKELHWKGISDEFRPLLSPIIINVCVEELITPYMMEATQKGFTTRRYYQIVEY